MKSNSKQTKRIVAELPVKAHVIVKEKCAKERITMQEAVYRFLSAWCRGEIQLPFEK